MAQYDNPLTDLRNLAASPLISYTPIIDAVGGANNIQIFDRAEDLRGDMQGSDLSNLALIMWPATMEFVFDYSNSSIAFSIRYAIQARTRGTRAKPVEYLIWLILQAYAFVYMNRQPGTSTPLSVPSPIALDAIKLVQADPDREPLGIDIDEWQSVCDVQASGTMAISSLTA